jgi:hypothetical protein
MKAGTAATLMTDHKRKTVAACVPDLHVTDGINYTTELHATPRMRPVLKGLISESEKANALTSLSAGALSRTLHSRDRWSQRNLRFKETNQGYPHAINLLETWLQGRTPAPDLLVPKPDVSCFGGVLQLDEPVTARQLDRVFESPLQSRSAFTRPPELSRHQRVLSRLASQRPFADFQPISPRDRHNLCTVSRCGRR